MNSKLTAILSVCLTLCVQSLLAQSTVASTGLTNVAANASVQHRALVADASGATTILEAYSGVTNKYSIAVMRYTSSGALIPVESSTEFVSDSFECDAASVDAQGRYAYVGPLMLNGVNKLVLRASTIAVGPSGGVFTDLGTYDREVDYAAITTASDPTYWLVSVSSNQGGGRIMLVRKDSGVVALSAPAGFVGKVDKIVVDGKGRAYLTAYGSSGSGGNSQVIAFDKTLTQLWQKTEPLYFQDSNGGHLRFYEAVFAGESDVYIHKSEDDYSTTTSVLNLIQKVDPNTGATISSISYPDNEYLDMVNGVVLKDGNVSYTEYNDDGNARSIRLTSNLGVVYSSTISGLGGGQFRYPETSIDRAGNHTYTFTSTSLTGSHATKVVYVDNQGVTRWTQTIDSTTGNLETKGVSFGPAGEIYVARFESATAPQWRISKLQPATFLPVVGDFKSANTAIMYVKFDGSATRLHRTGAGTVPMTFTHGNAFTPIAIHTTSGGTSWMLYSGVAVGSGKVVAVNASSSIPTVNSNFTLPANSGSMRDIAVDSSGRVWILTQVTIGNSNYLKYLRLNSARTAVDINRTLLISSQTSGVRSFDPIGTSFRFGCTTIGSTSILARIIAGDSAGAFQFEWVDGSTNRGVQDLRTDTSGRSLVLLSDFSGDSPGSFMRVNTTLTAIEFTSQLPWSPGLTPLALGDALSGNVRILWQEVGGKVFSRNLLNGSFGPATQIPAIMN